MNIQENHDILLRLRLTHGEIERFDIARDYLENRSDGVGLDILIELLKDDSDIIRSEVADYVILKGGVPANIIMEIMGYEKSVLVYPRLWLALAFEDKGAFRNLVESARIGSDSPFERAYMDAAMFVTTRRSFFIYDLCALACLNDIPTSHTAIDLLALVANDRTSLLKNLVSDLIRDNADNAGKAKKVLISKRK